MQQRGVSLLHQPPYGVMQPAALLARPVPVVAILNPRARHRRFTGMHQRLFSRQLDLMDIDFRARGQLLTNLLSQRPAPGGIALRHRLCRRRDSLFNTLYIKGDSAAVAFYNRRRHLPLLSYI